MTTKENIFAVGGQNENVDFEDSTDVKVCLACGEPLDIIQENAHIESLNCKNCGCNVRNRFFYHVWVAGIERTIKPARVLEVSGFGFAMLGETFLNRFSEKSITLVAGDFYERTFSAQTRVDLTDMRFPDSFFDAIGHSHVLEHIDEDLTAMKEMYRCLRPGGICYIAVPIQQDTTIFVEGEMHGDDAPVSRRNGWDIIEKLEAVGFSVKVAVPNQYFLEINNGEDIYLFDDVTKTGKYAETWEGHKDRFYPITKEKDDVFQGYNQVWGGLEVFVARKAEV